MVTALLLGTPSRQRMSALAAAAALFALCTNGVDQIAPLWAVRDLGLDPAGWAQLRGLRQAGTTAGILVLGLAAEFLGARRMAMVSLGGAGLVLAAIAGGGYERAFWLLPLFGALISVTYVNLNVLAQFVSERKQGIANGIYRGVSQGMVIVAPALATTVGTACDSYKPVLAGGAVVLGFAAIMVLTYPMPSQHRHAGWRELVAGLAASFRNRPLWFYILLDQLMAFTMGPIAAFGALRLTRELQLSEATFGLVVCTGAGTLGLACILMAGALSQRLRLSTLMGLPWLACAVVNLLMGLTDSLVVSMAAMVVGIACWAVPPVPGSIWLAQVTRRSPTGLAVHKLMQSATSVASMMLCGWLEPRLGMTSILLGAGCLGLPFAIWMISTPDPRPDGP